MLRGLRPIPEPDLTGIEQCPAHKQYKVKLRPRCTMIYPEGCPHCWKMWNAVQERKQTKGTENA